MEAGKECSQSRTLEPVTSGLNQGRALYCIYFNIIAFPTPAPFPSGYPNNVTEVIL
jgi:hypothetical protein